MIVISDASSLIAIAAVGHLDLLHRLYGEVIVPPAVWNEVTRPNRPGAGEVTRATWIKIVPPTVPPPLGHLSSPVGPGEAEAIALAVELRADVLLIDERKARKAALGLGLPVTVCWASFWRQRRAGPSQQSSRFSTRWSRWLRSG